MAIIKLFLVLTIFATALMFAKITYDTMYQPPREITVYRNICPPRVCDEALEKCLLGDTVVGTTSTTSLLQKQ